MVDLGVIHFVGFRPRKEGAAQFMSNQVSNDGFSSQSLKMAVVILLAIAGTVSLFVWVSSGPLFYATEIISIDAKVVKPIPDPERADQKFFSVAYPSCGAITETIGLGPMTLDEKAPPMLSQIRTCLDALPMDTAIKVSVETRASRITGSRSWRLRDIGGCSFPHLPSRLNVTDGARCPWM